MRYTILSLLLVSLISFSYGELNHVNYNDKYASVTQGKVEITNDKAIIMYAEFLQTYKGVNEADAEKNMDKFAVFKENLENIAAHNSNPARTYNKGVSAYTDMTDKEFLEYFRLNKKAEQNCSATKSPKIEFSNAAPSSFDWRDRNAVTPVKNQASCGSCWTFSTVGAMESHYNITKGRPGNFSEQQLVDCAGDYDCYGCMGGLPSYAFNYIRDHGLSDESHYNYTAKDGKCYSDNVPLYVSTSGPYNITARDEVEMRDHMYHAGPIACSFQVSSDFRDYYNGTFTSNVCKNSEMDINHAVLCVGYGHDNSKDLDFWAVKNSWGTSWGMNGYFQIERGVNMCGIGVCNSYPLNVGDYQTYNIAHYLKQVI